MMKVRVYPLGVIECPSTFCDVVNENGNHVCCISSVEDGDNRGQGLKEGIYWDRDGLPDVVVKDRLITFPVMRDALRALEKDSGNGYDLIRQNYFDVGK
ncbi:MAG: hypothetical protein KKE96_04165 [Candidatus Altiarchaeota archaeon]|nr:hypothetical protein [Candidatus Altiarchaeota archaeon]